MDRILWLKRQVDTIKELLDHITYNLEHAEQTNDLPPFMLFKIEANIDFEPPEFTENLPVFYTDSANHANSLFNYLLDRNIRPIRLTNYEGTLIKEAANGIRTGC